MKKLLSIVLVLVMVLTITACGSSKSAEEKNVEAPEAANTEQPTKEARKVIAGTVFQEDQFFNVLSAGYKAAAEERGYEFLLTNTNNDQSKETEALNTYAAQGVLGVAVSPMNTQISPAACEDAHNAGLVISLCNASLDCFPFAVASQSTDFYAQCHQTGEAAVEFIKEHYEADYTLKIGIIQYKTQVPEQSTSRVKGFLEALDEGGIKYEIVGDQDAWMQDMAVETAGDMISANPDMDIIFAANDGGTVGTVMAVENAGMAGKMYVFGTDGSEQIVSLLKNENNILQAVTAQNAFQIGYKTVQALCDAIEGKSFEGEGKLNIIPGVLLVRGNEGPMDEYLEGLLSVKG